MKVNINELNRIVIRNKDEADKLLDWRDSNKNLVRNFNPVLKQGMVVSFNDTSFSFDQRGDFIKYKVFINNEKIMDIFIIKLSNGMYNVLSVKCDKIIPSKLVNDNVQTIVTIHFSLMAYMENYREYVTERRQKSDQLSIKKSGGKNKKNNSRKIGKIIYEITIPKNITIKNRNNPDKPFPVCGHPRRYKSGKVIWIKSYTKGDKSKKVEPVIYHM